MWRACADAVSGAAAPRRTEDDAEVRGAARADGGHRGGSGERRGDQQAPVLADTGHLCGERSGDSGGSVRSDLDGTEPEGSAATASGDCAAEQRAGFARRTFAAHGEDAEFAGREREIQLRGARHTAGAIGRSAQKDGLRGRTRRAVAEAATGGYSKAAEAAEE